MWLGPVLRVWEHTREATENKFDAIRPEDVLFAVQSALNTGVLHRSPAQTLGAAFRLSYSFPDRRPTLRSPPYTQTKSRAEELGGRRCTRRCTGTTCGLGPALHELPVRHHHLGATQQRVALQLYILTLSQHDSKGARTGSRESTGDTNQRFGRTAHTIRHNTDATHRQQRHHARLDAQLVQNPEG